MISANNIWCFLLFIDLVISKYKNAYYFFVKIKVLICFTNTFNSNNDKMYNVFNNYNIKDYLAIGLKNSASSNL